MCVEVKFFHKPEQIMKYCTLIIYDASGKRVFNCSSELTDRFDLSKYFDFIGSACCSDTVISEGGEAEIYTSTEFTDGPLALMAKIYSKGANK